MNGYRNVLLAVDFNAGTERVVERAVELCKLYGSRLSLLHVVEPIPVDAGAETVVPPSLYLEQDYAEQARRKLAEIRANSHLAEVQEFVSMGHTKHEILRHAQEHAIDLIVVGSHGRHGLALLLGSTANAVLHGAPCDVLAVRL
jgi:universal stress protein A